MKWLIALLIFLPSLAFADMFGVDVGAGPNARPSYGFDLEKNVDGKLPYTDYSLMANNDFLQSYVSAGLQFEHINVGLGIAFTSTDWYMGTFRTAITAGPEIGYMYNLTKVFYVKENNTYLSTFGGVFTFGATLSLGVNF